MDLTLRLHGNQPRNLQTRQFNPVVGRGLITMFDARQLDVDGVVFPPQK